ncbi:MAG: Crp/Fnr family transcriptional regulator [Oxalobacteraceae bacterium]|nr:MAG: Crp/Fnr family transcriptional regulator [Oxalobacteraceae bacterium]
MDNVLTRKLQLFGELPSDDRKLLDEIIKLSFKVPADQELIREGDKPENVHVILSGLACRSQLLRNGRRQITAFLLPGDFCDLHIFILKTMDHDISTLAPSTVVRVPRARVLELTQRPGIARALWWTTLVDEATLRAALVNLGQRSAEERIAHLLCELHLRMLSVGLAEDGKFSLPLTQAELADSTGISIVHANRCIQSLRSKKLIVFSGKTLSIVDIDGLRNLAEFNSRYLHLDGGKHDNISKRKVSDDVRGSGST